jgi:hypothetical protein
LHSELDDFAERYRDASSYLLQRRLWGFDDVPNRLDTTYLYRIPQKVGFLVWIFVEVKPASGWVSYVKVDGSLLKFTLVVDKYNFDGLVLKYCC